MGQQSSRLLEICSTKFTSTGLHHSVCTIARKDLIIALWFFMLVFTIEANSSCNPEQVIWTNTVGKAGFKCLDCPSCPPGSEPSVPCGTKIENWTDISCVPCQPGKTYSNKNDTAHCKPCTVCSTGRAILKNCTHKSNSQCSRCKEGFYYELLSFSCRPCSECCGDDKDFVASECSRYKHKCKVRSTTCSEKVRSIKSTPRLKKSTPLPSIASTYHPLNSVITNKTKKPTRAFETDFPSDKSNLVIIALAAVAVGLTRIFFQIVIKKCRRLRDTRDSSGDVESRNGDESSPQSKALCESNQPDSQSNGSISPFLNRVFIQTSGSKTLHHICGESSGKSWPPLPQSQDSTSSQPYPFSPPAYVEYTVNPDELTLVGLEENYLDVFDWMCEELDAMQRDRWDFEKLAFRYNIPSATWRSFKNAFQRNGSPSHVLMVHLKALHPDLPLHHVIKNLELIGRNDIVHRLKPYVKKNVDRSSA